MVGAPSSSSESALLQSTLDCADDVIWTVDAKSLRVVAFIRLTSRKLLDDVQFLPKPFTPALLLLHVRRALDRAER